MKYGLLGEVVINIFPEWLYQKLAKDYLLDYVYEVRVRLNKPIAICYKGNYENITIKNGYASQNIIATQNLIDYIFTSATKHSLYAYNNEIKEGFITTDGGIRIGLCGEVVYNKNEVATIKNITSMNIRIAHQVYDCSKKIIDLISQNGNVKNTLVISPPGAGKTTIIRDIVYKLSYEKGIDNILVVDERFEISGYGKDMFDLGNGVDVISGSTKNFAFSRCLKTMNPKVVVTDEIVSKADIEEIMQMARAGVKIIASAHAENINNLKNKKELNVLLEDKVFERIVVLSKSHYIGKVEVVVDGNLKPIYLPGLLWRYC